jgi:hypothetical protein
MVRKSGDRFCGQTMRHYHKWGIFQRQTAGHFA